MSLAFSQLPIEPLTQEQANECARKIKRDPTDRQAINFLVMHSLREAVSLLRGLSHGKLTDGELISIAYSALERSARRYSPATGHRFFYFAKKALRGTLVEHYRKQSTVKHGEASMSMEQAEAAMRVCRNRHPDLEDPETTSELEGHVGADFGSLYRRENMALVMKSMKCLSKFERAIVLFIHSTGFTFLETAQEFGCSRAWVGLCWNRAVLKLRAAVAGK